MLSIVSLALFVNALPLVLRGFYGFFFSLLLLPFYLAEESSASILVTETSTRSTPPALPSIAGPLADLSANSIPFSVAYQLADSKGALRSSGSFNLFSQPGLTNLAAGRASAAVSGPLNVSIIAEASSTMTVPTLYLSGAAAIIPADIVPDAPAITEVAQLPGSTLLQFTNIGSTPGILQIPPGIQTDVNINQVIGRKPRVVWSFSSYNLGKVTLVITGTVTLSGLGYPGGFF